MLDLPGMPAKKRSAEVLITLEYASSCACPGACRMHLQCTFACINVRYVWSCNVHMGFRVSHASESSWLLFTV